MWAFWKFHGTVTINLNLGLSLRACAGEQAGVPESGAFHWFFTRPLNQAVGCVVGGLWQLGWQSFTWPWHQPKSLLGLIIQENVSVLTHQECGDKADWNLDKGL